MKIPYYSLEFLEIRQKVQILKHLSYPIIDINDEDKQQLLTQCYSKIICRFLRKVILFKKKLKNFEDSDFPDTYSISSYYYFYYPRIYVSSWIPLSGWKASVIRPYLTPDIKIRNRYDLFQLQMKMKKSDIDMIGW